MRPTIREGDSSLPSPDPSLFPLKFRQPRQEIWSQNLWFCFMISAILNNKYRQSMRMEEKMRTKNLLSLFAVIALVMWGTSCFAGDQPEAVYGNGANQFSLATGSPGELGLLKVLAETFGKQDNARMAWFKAGSGESLKLLRHLQNAS
jgi:hypothetical protein